MSIERDITTHFVRFASIKYKKVHELFIVKNSIPWWNIDFDRSYVIQYTKRNSKEKFDMLEHSQCINFFDFFSCKCPEKHQFQPRLWQYDTRHKDNRCSFSQRSTYFKLLQSVDNSLPAKEKLGRVSAKG